MTDNHIELEITKAPEIPSWKIERDNRKRARIGSLLGMLEALAHPKKLTGTAPERKREDPKTKKRRKMAERSRKVNHKGKGRR